jgi:nitric oxide dioxygenase
MSLNVDLLESSFARVAPNAELFVDDFYANLFHTHPEVVPMFATTDLKEQKKKLIGSLVLVIQNLKKGDVLAPALRGLGAKHVRYGVTAEHYPMVGGALLATLGAHLGAEWTPEVRQAWTDAYGAITALMLEGAEAAPLAA